MKQIITEQIKNSARSTRPIDIFTWLNSQEIRDSLMFGLTQPTLTQIQYYVRILRVENGASAAHNNLQSIIDLMKQWSYCLAKNIERAFFFGHEIDINGEIVLDDVDNFRVALTSKRLLNTSWCCNN